MFAMRSSKGRVQRSGRTERNGGKDGETETEGSRLALLNKGQIKALYHCLKFDLENVLGYSFESPEAVRCSEEEDQVLSQAIDQTRIYSLRIRVILGCFLVA